MSLSVSVGRPQCRQKSALLKVQVMSAKADAVHIRKNAAIIVKIFIFITPPSSRNQSSHAVGSGAREKPRCCTGTLVRFVGALRNIERRRQSVEVISRMI